MLASLASLRVVLDRAEAAVIAGPAPTAAVAHLAATMCRRAGECLVAVVYAARRGDL